MLRIEIDKIENGFVETIWEDGESVIIPKKYFPKSIKEGDIVNLNFSINKNETVNVQNSVKGLIDRLGSQNEGESFDL